MPDTIMNYEDNMSNFLSAFADQLKYIRDDIGSVGKRIDEIITSVNTLKVQTAKLEQHNDDRIILCQTHTNSVNELYARVNNLEIAVSGVTIRIDESAKHIVAVEKAEQKYGEWIKWIAPYLWKFALAAGAVIAAFQFWMKYEARPK